MAEFVHLHVHTEYSLLDGLTKSKNIAQRAVEHNQPAVAITDHGTMFAAIEFHDACRAAGVKPIIGVESYLAPRRRQDRDGKLDRNAFHLLLLAENETGYKNLLKLASSAQLEGFYYNPRVDKPLLEQYNDGIVVTSGCLSAEIPQFLVQGQMKQARQALEWYTSVFKDRFYIELQEHGIDELTRINSDLLKLAKEFNLKTVATNDVHYLSKEDWFAQDVLLCIQTGNTVNTADRMRMDAHDYWFKSTDEMAAVWREQPDALATTMEIAERCTLDLTAHGYRLPSFPVPSGYTSDSYMRALCEQGFVTRYGENAASEKRERLNYELRIIHKMGFDTYFLIVWDLTRFAREQSIWYNVRGSAAGSIVAYCLGITNLDPLEHNLIFERFLNPERISMPDIDLDFPDDAREEMIRYAVKKYGRDNVAQIITFGKMLAKAALRDVGRALDYPLSDVDRAAKLIPYGPGQTIDGTLENVKEFRELYEASDYMRKLIDNAKLLEGVTRNASTHAAGVVVTDRPVVEYVPLHRPTRGDESGFPVTQFPMGDLEHIGLLKIDFLGLATLTIMREACALIEKRHGVAYNLSNIPVEDEEAFKLLSRGDVVGVFQVEGGGMKRVLTQMKPTKFDHIVATISLYRPGPMEYIPKYIDRMHGKEGITYRHPALEPILGETFGIMVYQEQIIQIARDCCGYTGGEADTLRKAVGKKNREAIVTQREQFVQGAMANGLPRDAFSQVFDDIEYFARYGFNKAHAADYAVLTCQTAFLKAHYPLEYMTALMRTDIGNMDKIALFVADARHLGIPVLPPDVRYSDVKFTIDDSARGIRFGMMAIKNTGEGAVDAIVQARGSEPFVSLDDFCRRVDLRQVNRRALESLIKAGAFDAFGHRAQLLEVIDRMLAVSTSHHQASAMGQMSLFGGTVHADTFGDLPHAAKADNKTQLEWEKDLIGVYFSEHPLLKLTQQGKEHVGVFTGEITLEHDGQQVIVGGVIASVRNITTKKGDAMAFIQLEDPQGSIEVVAFPRTYNDAREVIRQDALVLVRGKVQVREEKIAVLADSIRNYPLEDIRAEVSPSAEPLPGVLDKTPVMAPRVGVDLPAEVEQVHDYRLDDWLPPPDDWEPDDMTEDAPPILVDKANERIEETTLLQAEQTAGESPEAITPLASTQLPDLKLGGGVSIPSKNGNGGNGKPTDGSASVSHSSARAPREPAPVPTYASAPVGARMVRVRMRRTDNDELDKGRLRAAVNLLRSVEGRDRFAFVLARGKTLVELDFPNYYTNYDAVAAPLGALVADWGELELG